MQAAEPAREAEMFEAAVHASLVVPYTTYTTHAKLVTLDLVSSYRISLYVLQLEL